jgi:hypothetical protein
MICFEISNFQSEIPMSEENPNSLSETLSAALPGWHFQPYGKDGAIACFPSGGRGPDAKRFEELSAIAVISSVCGSFYVVTNLRKPSVP